MISFLKGVVLDKGDRFLTVVVQDQVGYRIYTTGHILDAAHFNKEIALHIHTHVREDALELYGFANPEELDFFEKLIGISGVGPKSALGVMSVAPLTDIKKAVIHGDPKLLQKVSSIGKKTAERIIVDLKEKISVSEKEAASGVSITDNVQLLEALESLGYKESEVRKVMQNISSETKELSERIKEALKLLSSNK